MTEVVATPPRLMKSWGNEAVLYDQASGDTHYLKPLTLALYQTYCDHPHYTPAELAAALAARVGVANTPDLLDLIEDTLDQLRAINLLDAE
ncbi:MAG: HPr-rel-A system PqqD family peptide chaperone [Gammaproteobacteria bacterium]